MFSTLLQRTIISLAVITVFGILVHDTKFDQAATVALAIPIGMTLSLAHAPELKSEGHTHVERVSVDKAVHFVNGMPKIQARNDHRKYLLTRHLSGFNIPDEHTLMLQPALA